MTLTSRCALAIDAAALSSIHGHCFEKGWPEADFADWLSRPGAFGAVASSADAPLAFGLALTAGEDAELLTLACLPEARRSGAARAALRVLADEAGRRSLKRWILEVARDNTAALGLYRSEGFVEMGVRKGYYRKPGGQEDAIVMARPVRTAVLNSSGQAGG
ncbi:MAG: GNAT family N-acetyltransferase [Alphaproteobacteria bacterium]|nr:GNAT family N-acetyltransferase [Alphaproteobacteria bacterium]